MPRPSKTGQQGLYRDKENRYRIDLRWRDPRTGKQERFKQRLPEGISGAAAKNRAKEIMSAALAGNFDPKRERPRKLHAALDAYLEWKETSTPKSAASNGSLVKGLKGALPDRNLDEIAAFNIKGYMSKRVKAGAAPGTVNRAVGLLKHFYKYAAEAGWVTHQHAASIRAVRKLREPPGRVRWLEEGELTALFEVLPASIRPIVETSLLIGMRLGEVVELRKDAVDLGKLEVTLARTKNNRIRHLPIGPALQEVLTAAMARSTTAFVFVGRRGKPYTRHGFGGMFRRAVRKAGIEDFRFHDTRHDFASRVRRDGVGLDIIAKLLGHSSLAMANRYAHLGDEQMKGAVAGLRIGPISAKPEVSVETQAGECASHSSINGTLIGNSGCQHR